MTAEEIRSLVTCSTESRLWSDWINLSMSVTDWRSLPKNDGTYIIKSTQMISRLNSESDVVKIGQGKLRNRIKAYVHQHRIAFPAYDYPKRGTARRIRNFWRFTNHVTEFSYFVLSDKSDMQIKDQQDLLTWAKQNLFKYELNSKLTSTDIEKLLLVAYYKDHVESQPLHISFS